MINYDRPAVRQSTGNMEENYDQLRTSLMRVNQNDEQNEYLDEVDYAPGDFHSRSALQTNFLNYLVKRLHFHGFICPP